MKYFALLTLLFPSILFAESGFVLDLESGSVTEKQEENQAIEPEYNFKARDYFATRFEGSEEYYGVDYSQWPERVTFEPVAMDLETFKRGIIGKWQVMFTCGGRPLSSQQIAGIYPGMGDGYQNVGLIFDFGVQGRRTRYATTSILSVLDGSEAQSLKLESRSVEITSEGENVFNFRVEGFLNSQSKAVKILETGEIIIIISDSGLKCSDGQPLRYLLIRLGSPPMS